MKYFTALFFVIGIASISLHAQPIFTYTDFAPHNGDQYVLGNSTTSTSIISIGPNQTWNFSTAQIFSTTTHTVVPVSSVPVSSYYPGATQTLANSGGYVMLDVLTSEYLRYGATLTPGMPGYIYTDPEKVFAFPMNYGDSYNDAFEGQNYNGPEYRVGSHAVAYEGYGTLVTPYNTYSNVILIHSHYTLRDTTPSGGINDCSGEFFYWFAPGYRYPVAHMWWQPSSASCGLQSHGSVFLQSITIGYDELLSATNAIEISPNPFSDKVKIKISNRKQADVITISDIAGRIIRTFSADNDQMEIDLGEFEKGVYFIRVNNGRATKIVKN